MSFINYRDAKFCWHCHLVTQIADPTTSVILWLTPIQWINRHLAIPTNIPIGSVAEPSTLQYEPVHLETVPCLAAGYSKVGRALDLTLTDSQQTGAATQLEQSITVTLTLNAGDIHLAGEDGTNFAISTSRVART